MPDSPALAAILEQALAHHRAGRLAAADADYRRVLEVRPDHPDALHLLGVMAHHAGDHQPALELIGKAIAVDPSNAVYHHNIAEVYRATGRFDEAVAACRRVVDLKPDYADGHNGLGSALRLRGNLAEALAACRRAVALAPDHGDAHYNIGTVLQEQGALDDAITAYRRAVAINPGLAKAQYNLGVALGDQGRLEEAIDAYQGALDAQPDMYLARYNMGNLLLARNRPEDAATAYRRTLEDAPGHGPAHNNLGAALQEVGDYGDAEASYRHAVALDPDYAEAHVSLAMARLRQGDFKEGFEEYLWRWKSPTWPTAPRRYVQPLWDGSAPLAGQTVLLYGEQGLGDTIQFIRYAPLIAKLAGRVIVEAPAALERLLATVEGIDHLTVKGEALPGFDIHVPLIDLPRALGTTVDTVPAEVPYVAAEPGAVGRWRRRIGGGHATIGLVWTGNPAHVNDHNRSIALKRLGPLFEVPEARFFSLQVGPRSADPGVAGLDGHIEDLSADLTDFAETAAVLSALDLLISVDTAPLHLAGALGRPVWALIPFHPDWRWMLGRDDSPWYPSMRLFRQPARSDWDSVIARVRDELAALAAGAP